MLTGDISLKQSRPRPIIFQGGVKELACIETGLEIEYALVKSQYIDCVVSCVVLWSQGQPQQLLLGMNLHTPTFLIPLRPNI